MAVGAAAAIASGGLAAVGIPDTPPPLTWPPPHILNPELGIAAAAAAAFAAIAFVGRGASDAARISWDRGVSAVIGAVFAAGLSFSGMTLPGKVRAAQRSWRGCGGARVVSHMGARCGPVSVAWGEGAG
eukprot:365052-Chlamydomonas_euryale.AAC.10